MKNGLGVFEQREGDAVDFRARLFLFAALVFVTFGLWLSESPDDRRERLINQAIAHGQMAMVTEVEQQKLEALFNWLVKAAGVDVTTSVNKPIDDAQLDLVITVPKFAYLTYTGAGNAIYDPELDAIFIDQYLLQPIDLLHIGETSPFVQTTIDLSELDFVENYLTFIIAHELGHRQSGHRGGAFFSLDWLRQPKGSVEEELAADQYAVELLVNAHETGQIPDFIKSNSMSNSGLWGADEPRELAAAQVFSGLIGMSLTMQFGRGPYSPFFQDDAHPDFLCRALLAVERSLVDGTGLIKGQAPVAQERVRRTGALKRWETKLLIPPEPIARLEFRDGQMWVGTIPTILGKPLDDPLPERLYQVVETETGFELKLTGVGQTHDLDSFPGAWLDQILREGNPDWNLPGDVWWRVEQNGGNPPGTRQSEGFAYHRHNSSWSWKNGDQIRFLSEQEVSDWAKDTLSLSIAELGLPQYVNGDGEFWIPARVAAIDDVELRFLIVDARTSSIELSSLRPKLPEQYIKMNSILKLGDGWLVVGEDVGEKYNFHFVSDTGESRLISSVRLLESFIGESGDPSYGRDLDAHEFFARRLNREAVLVWPDIGAVWIVTPNSVNVAFNPADHALQITPIDENRAVFWMLNAHKAYVVDFSSTRDETKVIEPCNDIS